LTIQQNKGAESVKLKFSSTYFAGNITIEIIGKLTQLKKNDVRSGKVNMKFYCIKFSCPK
jgi:hypothetical protein